MTDLPAHIEELLESYDAEVMTGLGNDSSAKLRNGLAEAEAQSDQALDLLEELLTELDEETLPPRINRIIDAAAAFLAEQEKSDD